MSTAMGERAFWALIKVKCKRLTCSWGLPHGPLKRNRCAPPFGCTNCTNNHAPTCSPVPPWPPDRPCERTGDRQHPTRSHTSGVPHSALLMWSMQTGLINEKGTFITNPLPPNLKDFLFSKTHPDLWKHISKPWLLSLYFRHGHYNRKVCPSELNTESIMVPG